MVPNKMVGLAPFFIDERQHKVINVCSSTIKYVPDQYNVQEMYDKAISKNLIMLKYYPDRYQDQKLCNKTIDAFFQN